MRVDAEQYLEAVAQRLHGAGYLCSRDGSLDEWQPILDSALSRLRRAGLSSQAADPGNLRLDLLARKTESYMLSQVEAVFFFSRYSTLDADGLIAFLASGLAIAQATRKAPGKPMGVICVALVDDPNDLAVEEAEWGNLISSGSAGVVPVPVVLDLRYAQLHYFQQMPILSNHQVYLIRDLIRKYLLSLGARKGEPADLSRQG
jgi:hypothetical protein